jgi:Uma2 family endonuclease
MAETEQLHPYTYADLAAMPEDTVRREIIDGELIVSPTPDWWHQTLVLDLAVLFRRAGHGIGNTAVSPLDVRLSERDSVQPDVLFIRNENMGILAKDGRITGAPDIVVEIISSTSARYDRVRKFGLYERAGVPEYWILDYRDCTVTINELRDGRYHAIPPDADGRVRPRVLPNLAVSAEDLFAGIPPTA